MATDINALNQEIANLRKQLGDKPLTPFDSKDLDKALLTVKALRQEFRESSNDLDYIAKSFKDVVNEMSKQNTFYNSAKKSINGIADISRQIVDYRRGETSLSEKQLKNLQNQSRIKFEELKLAIRSGQLEQDNLIAAQKVLAEKEDFNNALDRTIKLQSQVNKEVGLLGAGLEGAGKFLEKMGFAGIAKPISDAIQKTKDARLQIKLNQDEIAKLRKEYSQLVTHDLERKKELRDQLASLKSQNKELESQQSKYKNIAIALKEQFTLVNMTDAIITKVVASFFKLDEAQTKFQNLTGGTIPMLDQMNMRLISSVDYIQTAASLTEQTGMNAAAIFTPDTLAAAAEMVKTMGMTQEQANKAAIMSQVNGQTIDQMNDSIKQGTKEHNATNRSALAQGAIMREVYNTSTALAASLGNSTKRITEAVTRAKDLGLSLSEVDGIANSLLNVEQSIASEFEYEVISGKQINLEAARYYALTNQTEKLTAEIGKNQAIVQSFASGNRIEQEAAAKALGLSRDQLAEMYMAQQRKAKLTDAEIAKNMHMEEGDVRRLSVQESINTSINKMTELLAGPLEMLASMMSHTLLMKTIFVAIGGIILTNIAAGLVTSLTTLGLITAAQTSLNVEAGIGAAINTESAGANAASLAATTAQTAELPALIAEEATRAAILNEAMMASVVAAEAATLGAATPFIIGGLAAVAGAAATYYAMKDGVIDPKKGPIVSGEFGSVQLHPNDQIVAGTNLIPNNGSSNSQGIDYERLGAHLANAVSKVQVQTNLDGVAVSRGLQSPMGQTTRKI